MSNIKTHTIALLFSLSGVVGCGNAPDDEPLKPRRAAVLVEGCTLDDWQHATLSAVETTQVLDEVVLRCLVLRQDGSIAPTDSAARSALRTLTAALQAHGYQVGLAVTAQTDDGVEHTPAQLLGILSDPSLRSRATSELVSLAPSANFLDLALPPLPDSGRGVMTLWATELSAALRPMTRLGYFAPPLTQEPSELAGGGAVDLRALAPSFDRIRLLTTDYSCCEQVAGPTTEPGWVTEVAQFVQNRIGVVRPEIDITLPLYGVDFSKRGQRPVSYLEAIGVAQHNGRQIMRAAGGSLHFDWTEPSGAQHELWFDDAAATIGHQRRFDPSIESNVGILYYGLGAEDPALFGELSRRR